MTALRDSRAHRSRVFPPPGSFGNSFLTTQNSSPKSISIAKEILENIYDNLEQNHTPHKQLFIKGEAIPHFSFKIVIHFILLYHLIVILSQNKPY